LRRRAAIRCGPRLLQPVKRIAVQRHAIGIGVFRNECQPKIEAVDVAAEASEGEVFPSLDRQALTGAIPEPAGALGVDVMDGALHRHPGVKLLHAGLPQLPPPGVPQAGVALELVPPT